MRSFSRTSALAAAAMPVVLAATIMGGSAALAVTPSPSPATGTWFDGLAAGVCFDLELDGRGEVDFSVPVTPLDCDQPHGHEVVARVPLGADVLPGDLAERVSALCETEYTSFLGRPIGSTGLVRFSVWPDEADWAAGVRDALCIVAGTGLIGTAASGDLSAPGEVLAAWWQPEDQADLWLFDGGTGEPLTALTDDTISELLGPPAWAPDGSSLLFAVLLTEDETAIFQVAAEGGPASLLVDAPRRQDGAVISPDGTRLAYISNEAGGEYDIFVRDLDSATGTPITDHPGRDATPRWSPDGSQILFRRETDGLSEIWVMNRDGSDATRLVENGVDSYDPRWSPDGATILFTTAAAGSLDIWAVDTDGSDVRRLTDHPGAEEYPTFSSDGRLIAFQSDRYGGPTLWLMRADGSDVSVLTPSIAPVGYPSFSPVGSR